jgi:signal transduction histidine kinase
MSNIEYKEGLLNGVLSCKNTLSSQNTALNTEAIIKTCIQNTRHHEKTSISYEIVSDLSKVPRLSSFLNYTETDISNPEVDNAQHVILTTNIIDDTDHFILIVILSLWFGIWSHLLIKIIPIKALEDSIQVLEKYVDENYKIRKEKEVAEESVRVRTMFLAKMSHELRTPLNGVIGMLDLVAHSNSESEKSINLKLAKKSADDLLMIVNDILDFSKIDEGELKVNHAPFDIHELLTTTKAILSVQSMQKNIPILLEIDSLVPKYIVSDQTRLRQILINLVGNALKFTHQGKITISVTYTVNTLVISVSDTGIGISSEKLESVFNPFTQAETETSRTYGGTGLGHL